MPRKFCRVDLNTDIDKIVKLAKEGVKSQDKDMPESLAKYIDESFDQIGKDMKEGTLTREDFEGATVEQLKGKIKREIIDVLNTYKSVKNITSDFDKIAKRSDAGGIKGAIRTLFQNTDQRVTAEKVWFDHTVDTIFENLDKGGVRSNPEVNLRAHDMFYDAIAGGSKLKDMLRKIGLQDPDKELYMALREGTSKIPELDVIARAVKVIDSLNTTRVLEKAPYFNVLGDHVLPLRVDPDKVRLNNKEDIEQFFLENLNREGKNGQLTDHQVRQKAAGLYDTIEGDTTLRPNNSYKSTTRIFGHRKFHFNSAEAEWAFMKNFGRLDDNLLGSVMRHKRSLLMTTALHNTHGPNVGFNLHALQEHISAKHYTVPKQDIINDVTSNASMLETRMGMSAPTDEITNNLWGAVRNAISYALTGSAAVRDLLNDKSIYSGLMSHMFSGKGQLPETAKAFWGTLKNAVRTGQTEKVARLFEMQGIMIKMKQATLYQGHIDDSLGDAYSKSGKLLNVSRAVSEGALWGRDKVSKFSAADRINNGGRAFQAVNAGHILIEGLEQGWESLPVATRGLIEQAGVGKAEWGVLRKAKRVEFEGRDLTLDTTRFSELSDDLIDTIKRPLESRGDTRLRLKYGFQTVQKELLDHLSTITSVRGQIDYRGRNPHVNGLVRTALSFTNIGLSQWYNLMRALRLSTEMDPNVVGGANLSYIQLAAKNPKAFATMLGTQVTGGMLILWAQDLMQGKTPRDITPQNLLFALAASGAGGLISTIYSQLLYNKGQIGTPLDAFVRPAVLTAQAIKKGNWEGARRNIGKEAQYILPMTNMWWTKLATKKLMQEALHYDDTAASKRIDKELGREDWTK